MCKQHFPTGGDWLSTALGKAETIESKEGLDALIEALWPGLESLQELLNKLEELKEEVEVQNG